MIALAHRHGALALVDGAQSVVAPARPTSRRSTPTSSCFSGHKMFAPTGIGVVYGKQAILETMPPWQGGGNMIADVTFERTLYQGPPDAVRGRHRQHRRRRRPRRGDRLSRRASAWRRSQRHEHDLIECDGRRARRRFPACVSSARRASGPASSRFVLDGYRAEDVGKALDRGRHRGARRPSLRPADPAPLRRRERRSGRRSRSTTRSRTSRRCSPRCVASPCAPMAARGSLNSVDDFSRGSHWRQRSARSLRRGETARRVPC